MRPARTSQATHAGVALLKSRSEIDPARIGLLGSSEGGLVAALAAVQSSDVAFIVMLASPGQSMQALCLDQFGFILEDLGADERLVQVTQDHYRRVFEALRHEQDDATAE